MFNSDKRVELAPHDPPLKYSVNGIREIGTKAKTTDMRDEFTLKRVVR